tara:strand:+ start:478 stop:1725 length:1248 start_codon:yes stop_codon:yes gene_type:complete
MSNNFINHITERGFFNQCTNIDLLNLILKKPTTAYIGFDCTADSLHIGSLLPIMLLRIFQKYGHVPIVLLGGGTTLIGDPSGKDETREILTIQKIKENKDKLRKLFSKFLSFEDKKNPAIILDNYEWIKGLNYVDFIRDIGSQFSVNRMLSLESVKQRLTREQHLSFLEFNYAIIQSYDFLELHKNYNCSIQFGGSDQWGNIVSGIELIKKKTGKETIGLTSPLMTTSSGQKMGKTNKGAIWLDNEKLNYFDYWQYWRNVDDKDVIKFLKLFTEVDIDEINKYKNFSGSEFNKIKILLANEATKICHGETFAKKAEQSSMKIFSEGKVDKDIPEKNKLMVSRDDILKQKSLKEYLVLLSLSKSLGESKRLIENGGVKINKNKIIDKNYIIRENDFNNNLINISVGKKKNGLIEIY